MSEPEAPPLSFHGARWRLRDIDERALGEAMRAGWSRPAARCLTLRGFHADPRWLAAGLDHLHDPFAMASMDQAVARLRLAADRAERVRIITDYDVDGTTSSLILQATLRVVAPKVQLDHHIPDRFAEGYGFSAEAARQAARDGVQLIVTADIGVRDHAAVQAAREAGVDVLICDHHLPSGASVPDDAIVLCPPQAACTYPNAHLAACGVSIKLAQALLVDHPKREALVESLLKLAAIGTVADMVPLNTLENRAIVSLGLQALNRGGHSAGLTALLEVCGLTLGQIGADDLSFRIGPRINAAGRIASATHIIELLTCREPVRARELAAQLEGWNQERRSVQHHLVEAALRALPTEPAPFVVVAGPEEEGWHRGVVGIVAARLKDQLHRPVAVLSIQGDFAVGSVRSVPEVHAVEALTAASDLLVKFGGHPAAAGFTVPTGQIDALRARLIAWTTSRVGAQAFIPEQAVDAELEVGALDERLLTEIERLSPFGMGNPEPNLVVRRTHVTDPRPLGKERQHLKWRLGQNGVEAVWWSSAQHLTALTAGPVDLLGRLSANVWNGRRTLQFVVQDVRVAER
jgi:single-stranded-DNA-specific exonuclease